MDNAKLAIYVALGSLAIAVFSFGWNVINQINQNDKWHALNSPNVELTNAKLFLGGKTYTEDEVNTPGFWGYKVSFQRDNENLCRTTASLTAKYQGKVIPNFNSCFRLIEVQEQLKKKGIDSDYIILKHYEYGFQIENKGNTEAVSTKTKITMQNPYTNEWAEVANSETNLSPGIKIWLPASYDISYEMQEPENVNYKIEISYKDINNKQYSKQISATYNARANIFSYKKI